MIQNTIHEWLDYKYRIMSTTNLSPIIIFKSYLNSLALACEAKLNLSNDVKQS